MSLILLVLRPLAIPVTLLLHRRVGERFLGFSGLFAAALMVMMTDNGKAPNSGPLMFLAIVYSLRAMGHYLDGGAKPNGIVARHSRDPGDPFWGLLNKWVNPVAGSYIEAVLVMAAGFFLAGLIPLVGGYLFLSGAAMFAVLFISGRLSRDKVLDQIDAIIEERRLAEDIRALIGQGDVEVIRSESADVDEMFARSENRLPSSRRALPLASTSS